MGCSLSPALYLQVQLTESTSSSAKFERHVLEASRVSDELSRRRVRTYQLYSRASGAHVQVLGTHVVARGDDGDPYALLQAETDSFGGNIRLRGVRTKYHICMDRNGKLVGKLSGRYRGCVFSELYLENHYTALRCALLPERYAAFGRSGRAKNGGRTTSRWQFGVDRGGITEGNAEWTARVREGVEAVAAASAAAPSGRKVSPEKRPPGRT
uniref:Fibroblast growth factor 8b-like n=1 Tax=Petromyzon marinus TaxID=7757 RepID=A0AAJ7SKC7_PETMA|nr:fibroblast growth factor 8b-like [Petromyzon marinus]